LNCPQISRVLKPADDIHFKSVQKLITLGVNEASLRNNFKLERQRGTVKKHKIETLRAQGFSNPEQDFLERRIELFAFLFKIRKTAISTSEAAPTSPQI
jgi:hypothetical protein